MAYQHFPVAAASVSFAPQMTLYYLTRCPSIPEPFGQMTTRQDCFLLPSGSIPRLCLHMSCSRRNHDLQVGMLRPCLCSISCDRRRHCAPFSQALVAALQGMVVRHWRHFIHFECGACSSSLGPTGSAPIHGYGTAQHKSNLSMQLSTVPACADCRQTPKPKPPRIPFLPILRLGPPRKANSRSTTYAVDTQIKTQQYGVVWVRMCIGQGGGVSSAWSVPWLGSCVLFARALPTRACCRMQHDAAWCMPRAADRCTPHMPGCSRPPCQCTGNVFKGVGHGGKSRCHVGFTCASLRYH